MFEIEQVLFASSRLTDTRHMEPEPWIPPVIGAHGYVNVRTWPYYSETVLIHLSLFFIQSSTGILRQLESGSTRAEGVIEINQTVDPGGFLVGARSRFLGHYSIFWGV